MLATMGEVQRTQTNRPEVKGLSVQQTAERMGIGRTLVFDLIKNGELASLKIGRRRIVTTQAIDEFLAQQSADQHRAQTPKGICEAITSSENNKKGLQICDEKTP